MPTSSEPDPESVNAQLAEFICGRKEEIIRAWLGRVQADPVVPTAALTPNQLRDHLPRLLDDLADTLRLQGNERVAEQTEEHAEKHGIERWQQGYDVVKLLREVMHLRGVFIYHLRVFEELHPDLGTAARLFAHSEVHRFLDEMDISGVVRFLQLEMEARRGGSGLQL